MLDFMRNAVGHYLGNLSRRELLRRGSLLASTPAVLGLSRSASAAVPATAGKLQLSPDIYKSIGVRPLINCRGTLTVISGSMELPEVRAAVDAGGQHHVVLDELMEAAARRLAELTGAEWALVSAGCAAGLSRSWGKRRGTTPRAVLRIILEWRCQKVTAKHSGCSLWPSVSSCR